MEPSGPTEPSKLGVVCSRLGGEWKATSELKDGARLTGAPRRPLQSLICGNDQYVVTIDMVQRPICHDGLAGEYKAKWETRDVACLSVALAGGLHSAVFSTTQLYTYHGVIVWYHMGLRADGLAVQHGPNALEAPHDN